jgi:5'-methylthioadenosine phosphorylase
LPQEVNYRANIFALKELGVRYIISVSAVGSLKEEHSPTTFVLPSQFIDWTKGKRERTFFGDGVVAHVSLADPINKNLQEIIASSCKRVGVKNHVGGSYLCIEGPQFSTRAESAIYRSFGADIIGMTNVPEAFLAKEAGIAYATIGMVTDYDCWKEEHCTVEEIMKVMAVNNQNAQKVLLDVLPSLDKNKFAVTHEAKHSVMTDLSGVDSEKRAMLDIILG